MPSVDMLSALVVFKVVCQVVGTLIVHGECRRLHLLQPELAEEGMQGDRRLTISASLVASDAATISASHDDRATVACFLDDKKWRRDHA
eukprot:6184188-Pleurochrysis_carterae.AAC.2